MIPVLAVAFFVVAFCFWGSPDSTAPAPGLGGLAAQVRTHWMALLDFFRRFCRPIADAGVTGQTESAVLLSCSSGRIPSVLHVAVGLLAAWRRYPPVVAFLAPSALVTYYVVRRRGQRKRSPLLSMGGGGGGDPTHAMAS